MTPFYFLLDPLTFLCINGTELIFCYLFEKVSPSASSLLKWIIGRPPQSVINTDGTQRVSPISTDFASYKSRGLAR